MSKKHKNLCFQIEMNPYKRYLVVFFDCSDKFVREKLLKEGNHNESFEGIISLPETTLARFISARGVSMVRFTKKYRSMPELHGSISHECVHIAFGLLVDVGVVISDDSEEALTYLVEYLVAKITNRLIEEKVL